MNKELVRMTAYAFEIMVYMTISSALILAGFLKFFKYLETHVFNFEFVLGSLMFSFGCAAMIMTILKIYSNKIALDNKEAKK